MGLFKDDDKNELDALNVEDNSMSNFEDANVDKDLLNQIFADEGEEFTEDSSDGQLSLDGVDFDIDIPAEPEEAPAEENVEPAGEETFQMPVEEPVIEEPVVEEVTEEEIMEDIEEPVVSGAVDDDVVNEEARKAMDAERSKGTVTVITENTTINGSISSDGSLEVMGVITGDIECLGKVYINGKVSGGVVASEIFVNTPKLQGGLTSEGTVKIGVGTMIIGDVSGTSAYIAGAVKGNIDIDGPVIIESTAIVKGDIRAKSITINSGAVVDGYCSLNYAGVDLDKFFDEE